MGAVQAQILRAAQGARMALTQAPVSAASTSCKSRMGATLLSLLLLPISPALPTTEGQNWLARSTCVLDALAHGGVVDSEKFNQCMDCWRRSSDESLQTATACLTSLPQFCKEDKAEDGARALFFVWSWTARCRTWSADGAPPQASLVAAFPSAQGSPLDLVLDWQDWEQLLMQPLQISSPDLAWQL